MRFIGDGKLWDDQRIRKFIERQQKLQKVLGHCLWVLELQEAQGRIGFCGIAPFEPPSFLEIGWGSMKPVGVKDMLLKRRSEIYPMPHKNCITQLRSVSHQDHIRSQAVMRQIVMRHERDALLGIFGKEPKDLPIRVYVYDHKPKSDQVSSKK